MEEREDKSKTMEFTPVHKEKEQVKRTENSIYSQARKNNVSKQKARRKKEKQTKIIATLTFIAAMLIILVVVVGIVVINMEHLKETEETPIDNISSEINSGEEEEIPPEEEEITACSVTFYGDSVKEVEGGYSVLADLLDSSFEKTESRRLYITEETDFTQNGPKLSVEGLMYAVERMAGDGSVFDVQIREKDDVVVSVSYDGNLAEELKELEEVQEEVQTEEEILIGETHEEIENEEPGNEEITE